MFTLDFVHNAIADFKEAFDASIEEINPDSAVESLRNHLVDDVRVDIKDIFNRAILAYPEGIPTPRIRQDLSIVNENELRVKVQIKAASADDAICAVFSGESEGWQITQWVSQAFTSVMWTEFRGANLAEINETIGRLSHDAGNPFSVELVEGGKGVVYIANDKVVLSVNEALLFGYSDLLIFQERIEFDPVELESGEDLDIAGASEFNNRYDTAWQDAVTKFKATSPVEFLLSFAKTDLGKVTTNLRNKKLATLLRGSQGNTPTWLTRTDKDTRIKYDVDGVFGIIERKDGVLSVSLDPVNVETGEPVEVDIVSAVQQ